jgi:hypothetical protein
MVKLETWKSRTWLLVDYWGLETVLPFQASRLIRLWDILEDLMNCCTILYNEGLHYPILRWDKCFDSSPSQFLGGEEDIVLPSPYQTFMRGFESCDSCFDVLRIIKGITCFSFCSRIRTHHYSNLVLSLTYFPILKKLQSNFYLSSTFKVFNEPFSENCIGPNITLSHTPLKVWWGCSMS